MEGLQRKTVSTRRSLKYTYYVTPSRDTASHPALLFLHGFPDSAHLWSSIVAALQDIPNKIIVPDCLGYAGTDKPEDTSLYAYNGQADDIVDILDNENATSTIIIGHDWGSALTQRTYLHHRERFSGMVLVNVGYMVPTGDPFDLATVNEFTKKTLGYPQFSYWELFTAPDGAKVMDDNLERVWLALHGDVDEWMKKMFCVPGAMREFLLSQKDVPLKSYATKSLWKDEFLQRFKADGFASSLQMYKATATNVQSKSDALIPKDKLAIEVPILFIICTQDAVCVPELMTPAKENNLVPDLKEVTLECAHWSPMEKPDEIASHIRSFLSDRFSQAGRPAL